MDFTKAYLQEVTADPKTTPKPVANTKFDVQVNPASLRLQATASVDSRKDAGHQRSQYQGTTSTLSFDLVFDTSDEGTTDVPVDVRDRTKKLERFLWPAEKGTAPPRVQFTYGTFTIVGVMKSLSTDLDLFSANGMPLRAKCAVQIEEQKPAFDAKQEGAGSKPGLGATDPLKPDTRASSPSAAGGAPGGPRPPTDRTGTALAGESASSFANRMGLDPLAWKGLQGITDPMSLDAGQLIDFPSNLSLDQDLGTNIGATSTAPPTSAEEARAQGPTPRSLDLDPVQLTTAGGLTRALDDATSSRVASAASASANAFAGTPAPASPSVSSGTVARVSAGPDPRASGYGFGVPLRPRRGTTAPASTGLVHERSSRVVFSGDRPPELRGSSVPSWLGLAAEPTESGCGCGCRGRA